MLGEELAHVDNALRPDLVRRGLAEGQEDLATLEQFSDANPKGGSLRGDVSEHCQPLAFLRWVFSLFFLHLPGKECSLLEVWSGIRLWPGNVAWKPS